MLKSQIDVTGVLVLKRFLCCIKFEEKKYRMRLEVFNYAN